MITMLMDYKDGTYGIVSDFEVSIGEEFQAGVNKEGKAIIKPIENIIEQRKEKGTYIDENKRRLWLKVS